MENNIKAFNELVLLRYQVYNSIFLTLELDGVHRTGILLPLLSSRCAAGFEKGSNPEEIMMDFFGEVQEYNTEDKQIDQLFRFIQFIERQVVLVDALEDAAFDKVHNLEGSGSFTAFFQNVSNKNRKQELTEALKYFKVRTVLTAHPTQFYPGAVLGIITDLSTAIKENNLVAIKEYLAQLGKTPYFKKTKPTPYDEAVSLTWYLENVFYHAIAEIFSDVSKQLGTKAEEILKNNNLLQLGFWPGGDRDGNPFVDVDTTLNVAQRLRTTLMKAYYRDVRNLKRRITFRESEAILQGIEQKLYDAAFVNPQTASIKHNWLTKQLDELRENLIEHHQGLYLERLDSLRQKVKIFGFHFSSLDIRQDSRVLKKAFVEVAEKIKPWKEKQNLQEDFEALLKLEAPKKLPTIEDPVLSDAWNSLRAMKTIQEQNGPQGCYRFIISNCRDQNDVARVFAMAKSVGFGEKMFIDIIPLFETIDDLSAAASVMEKLYSNKIYMSHLRHRGKKQVVMLGFSDGTKDGGYITANWSIFRAKENISQMSRSYGISVVFFDGRGGPPARGGGNTHKFYASLGPSIESNQIQITVQGQTISSNFGTVQSCRYNLEQLLTAGLENSVLSDSQKSLNADEREIMDELARESYSKYREFKAHPMFLPYLENMSTLQYYGETNIGSRPAKRGKSSQLKFEDLRAIPFVGAWSQLKQNVPGFYGLGYAFEIFDQKGQLQDLIDLYKNSLFFRTLCDNSMQSLSKSYFALTAYMQNDQQYGEFWNMIYRESLRAKKYLLAISGQSVLLETNPSIKASIKLREEIVLPLLTIQQYALMRIKKLESEGKGNQKMAQSYRKLVVRSLYGNINASRNSA